MFFIRDVQVFDLDSIAMPSRCNKEDFMQDATLGSAKELLPRRGKHSFPSGENHDRIGGGGTEKAGVRGPSSLSRSNFLTISRKKFAGKFAENRGG